MCMKGICQGREANAIEIRSMFVEVAAKRSVRLGLLSICVGITFCVVDMHHYLFAHTYAVLSFDNLLFYRKFQRDYYNP